MDVSYHNNELKGWTDGHILKVLKTVFWLKLIKINITEHTISEP